MKKLSKGIIKTLELYCILVYYRYKHSYLVDCCCIEDVNDMKSFLSDLCIRYALHNNTLGMLQIHSDIFIINLSILKSKIYDDTMILNENLIINIRNDSNSYQMMSSIEDIDELQLLFQSHFLHPLVTHNNDICITDSSSNNSSDKKQQKQPIEIKVLQLEITRELEDVVSLPFVAGWLLGYPTIYRSSNHIFQKNSIRTLLSTIKHNVDKEDEVIVHSIGNSLSMVTLLKVSINAMICFECHITTNKQRATNNNFNYIQQEILNFTIPISILDDDPLVSNQFYQYIDELINKLTANSNCLEYNHINNHKYYFDVKDIKVIYQELIAPSIVL